MKTSVWMLLLAAFGLSACDLVTTTATVGSLQAEEAEQARQQQKVIEQQLKETQQLVEQRTREMNGAASDNAPPNAAP